MGCSSCSTTTGGSPSGCKNNGTCGTTGCNKLNVYNWLSDMTLPDGQKPFPVVEVRFKGSRKEFYRNVNNLELKNGDVIAVEGSPGHDIGTVSIVGELVRLQLKKKGVEENSPEIKSLYRIAKDYDIEKWQQMKEKEVTTMYDSRKIALELGLQMKLSDVEYQGDGKKATFFYTAEDRVDFRELIKRLADRFKVRIEMRQIGMRQEASRLGGIGSCGRELCCSTWLTDFKAVTTSAARYQNLSLNPIKLAGQCGKLKCCLNYELDSYMDAIKDFPDTGIRLELKKGYAKHVKTDIFKRMMWYSFTLTERTDEWQPAEAWIPLSVDRVKEIIELNKNSVKPDELKSDVEIEIKKENVFDYENVVGQDSITRMDKKKKKKKKSQGQNQQQRQGQQQGAPQNQQRQQHGAKQGVPPNQPQRKEQQVQKQGIPQNQQQRKEHQGPKQGAPQNQQQRPGQQQGSKQGARQNQQRHEQKPGLQQNKPGQQEPKQGASQDQQQKQNQVRQRQNPPEESQKPQRQQPPESDD